MRYTAARATRCRRTADGATQDAHWRAAARRGNVDAQRALRWPRYPRALAYLEAWYYELSLGRPQGGHGVAPLTWQDIDAWATQMGYDVRPHERRALLLLDAAFRDALRPDDHEPSSPANAAAAQSNPARQWPGVVLVP
jgi:hypothetical protein